MKVVYSSLSGMIREFVVNKLEVDGIPVSEDLIIDEPFVLITRSVMQGETPKDVETFLEHNYKNLVGVVGSGDMGWGRHYCGGAIKVANKYNVPLLHKFEKRGYPSDVQIVTDKIKELEGKS